VISRTKFDICDQRNSAVALESSNETTNAHPKTLVLAIITLHVSVISVVPVRGRSPGNFNPAATPSTNY
jgi:hypothetical protein